MKATVLKILTDKLDLIEQTISSYERNKEWYNTKEIDKLNKAHVEKLEREKVELLNGIQWLKSLTPGNAIPVGDVVFERDTYNPDGV